MRHTRLLESACVRESIYSGSMSVVKIAGSVIKDEAVILLNNFVFYNVYNVR